MTRQAVAGAPPGPRGTLAPAEAAASAARRDEADDFAFPPDSLIWRVCRERCNLLAGGAAAVLQVAHEFHVVTHDHRYSDGSHDGKIAFVRRRIVPPGKLKPCV